MLGFESPSAHGEKRMDKNRFHAKVSNKNGVRIHRIPLPQETAERMEANSGEVRSVFKSPISLFIERVILFFKKRIGKNF